MKIIVALAFIAVLAGCATPTSTYRATETAISEPTIGVETIANVGDKMLTQGLNIQQDGIEVLATFKPSWAYTIGAGSYLKTGDSPGHEFYMPKFGSGGGVVEKAAIADPWKSVMLDQVKGLCVVTMFNAAACENGAQYNKKSFQAITERSFQQTLIYSGKIGNKINVGYREFSADLARMAFNNNVEYDLSESKTIGYKGAEIEVIEATNRFIKYRLIRNFNSAVR